ncbi:hypothetical protein RHGRI_015230 [Rhododendron griersonianum]|uniref:Dof zinc finger protein n=1 Tax=Rhododendron griersonianum TaxID=479676 RepID=A0AAV6KCK1_9ERIC|nr:hypothetical protein RHGRI_015230 [Rhododendron griersonianum]
MVFSSIPAYLDPSNWQQQSNAQVGLITSSGGHQLPPPPPPQVGGGGGPGSIRPGSLADRARMANIPIPEAALKCPRCESTNTKFCYFNNYSLSQPRHFCKTCRRYWTRGGALRSVPVGGGCRRNKRTNKGSSSSSKSPANSGDLQTSGGGTGGSTSAVSTSTASLLGLISPQIPPLRFMAPLSQLTGYGGTGDIGLNYGGTSDMNFHLLGNSSLGGGGGGNAEWRFQPPQMGSMGGLDLTSGLYPFHHQGGMDPSSGYVGEVGPVRPRNISSGPGFISAQQSGSVKMEDNPEMNLPRQFLGIQGNEQYWSGTGNSTNAWSDFSGFSSSSTTNHL